MKTAEAVFNEVYKRYFGVYPFEEENPWSVTEHDYILEAMKKYADVALKEFIINESLYTDQVLIP